MNLIVLTMAVMILLYKVEDIINVYLYLLDKLHLKLDVVINIGLVAILVVTVVIMQVDVNACIVLDFSCCKRIERCKLVEAAQKVYETEYCAKQLYEVTHFLFSHGYSTGRDECLQLFYKLNIALEVLAPLVCIAVEIVLERTEYHCALGVRIAKE